MVAGSAEDVSDDVVVTAVGTQEYWICVTGFAKFPSAPIVSECGYEIVSSMNDVAL